MDSKGQRGSGEEKDILFRGEAFPQALRRMIMVCVDGFEVTALVRMNSVYCKIMEIEFGSDWELSFKVCKVSHQILDKPMK